MSLSLHPLALRSRSSLPPFHRPCFLSPYLRTIKRKPLICKTGSQEDTKASFQTCALKLSNERGFVKQYFLFYLNQTDLFPCFLFFGTGLLKVQAVFSFLSVKNREKAEILVRREQRTINKKLPTAFRQNKQAFFSESFIYILLQGQVWHCLIIKLRLYFVFL